MLMKDLIDYIAKSLVDDPTQVSVTQVRHGSQTIFRLKVAKEDMGRVIGKKGRVAERDAYLADSLCRAGWQARHPGYR